MNTLKKGKKTEKDHQFKQFQDFYYHYKEMFKVEMSAI